MRRCWRWSSRAIDRPETLLEEQAVARFQTIVATDEETDVCFFISRLAKGMKKMTAGREAQNRPKSPRAEWRAEGMNRQSLDE